MPDIIFYAIIAVLFIWFLKVSNGTKWGVNLKRVICPVCQTRQPIIRMPNSLDQGLWGGTTCPKCQTKLDKYGNIIR